MPPERINPNDVFQFNLLAENENQPVTPVVQQEPPVNAENQQAELNFFQSQQRFRLNNNFVPQNNEERNTSALLGGTSGSTAAQFELSEQSVRDTGVIRIVNNPGTPTDFVDRVEADIQTLAPNSYLERRPTNAFYQQQWDNMYGSDTLAIVRRPENMFSSRVSGSEQGYRLFDQLLNNSNEVTIGYVQSNMNAGAAARSVDSFGSVTNPGRGSAVDIIYDPYDMNVSLPVRDGQGNLVNSSSSNTAIILGHELGHASHMQRGTRQNFVYEPPITNLTQFGSHGRENVFSSNGQYFLETDNTRIRLREEYRNVGFDGFRYGNEPNENSLRRQLGITDQRISYQDDLSYQPISRTDAFFQQTSNRFQTTSDSVVDGFRGSRTSAFTGAGFNALTGIYQGRDAQGVFTDALVGGGTGVTEEVIQRVVNGPASTTSGMTTSSFRTAASQVRGAGVAGAVIGGGFAVYDNWSNLQNDSTRSQAVGTIAGEVVVGAGSAMAGAYAGAWAGAAIGSVVPGVGTVIGGVVGFAVGAGVGYLTDRVLRAGGVDKMIASGVTQAYDAVSGAVSDVAQGARDFIGGAANTLSSIFG